MTSPVTSSTLSGLPVPATQQGALPASSMHLAVTRELAVTQEPANGSMSDAESSSLLTRLIRYFEQSEDSSWHARSLAERDCDFYHGQQLTEVELAALKERRQPPSVNNYVRRKVSTLLGTERRGRADVKCYPRNPQHQDMSDVATQALRYINDSSRFDVTRSLVYEDMLIFGYGGAEVVVEPRLDRAGYDVVLRHVPWTKLWYDPHSSQGSFNDAAFRGLVCWEERADVLRRYPGSESVLEASFAGIGYSQTYDDKPVGIGWCDNRRSRVRTVQCHYREGDDWWTATYTRGGFLEPPMKSPYVDHHGKSACPLIMQSAYVDRNNNRYGVVRDMISLQEAINKRESKLLHLLNVNQLVLENGAVDDLDMARREAAKPDGVLVKNRGFEFEMRRDQSEVAGHFQLLQHSISQLNVQGPNAAMSGKDPREQSGRAILAQQAGGMVELEPMTDSLRQWNHRIQEASWMRVRQFWTGPEFIRVTDDSQSSKFVGLNLPVTLADEIGQMDPDQAQQVTQQLQLQPNDPRLQQVVRIQNDIDSCDVEIQIEEGPDTPTLQIEQWQAFTQLPQAVLQQFPPEFFIEANPAIRDKDKLRKILSDHQDQQASAQAAQAAAQQAMQHAQVAKVAADAQDKQAQAADRQAQTVERLHGIAKDHATAMHTPIVPGVGPVAPDQNPLLQPATQPAMQGPPGPPGADGVDGQQGEPGAIVHHVVPMRVPVPVPVQGPPQPAMGPGMGQRMAMPQRNPLMPQGG